MILDEDKIVEMAANPKIKMFRSLLQETGKEARSAAKVRGKSLKLWHPGGGSRA